MSNKEETVTRPRILIGFPCMSMIPVQTATSLIKVQKPAGAKFSVVQNSLIHYARNEIAAKAITDQVGYDAVMWIDSDIQFESDAIIKLVDDMFGPPAKRKAKPIIDYVAGMFFKRSWPTSPVIYKDIDYVADTQNAHCKLTPYDNYPINDVFECAGTGFGFVLTSTALLKRVWEAYGPPFDPMLMLGEDLSFCQRCKELGEQMYCDSRVMVGHVGNMVYNEDMYNVRKMLEGDAT